MENVRLTIEYWKDDGWYVGQLVELPNVLSQGRTLDELKENIQDAYGLVIRDSAEHRHSHHAQVLSIPLCVPA